MSMLAIALNSSGFLGLIGVGFALALVVVVILNQAEDKAVVRSSLRQLEGYEVENLRERELLNPLKVRALKPVLHTFTGLGRRLSPKGYVEGVRHKFVLLGRLGADPVDRFLAIRFVTVVAILPVWILIKLFLPLSG